MPPTPSRSSWRIRIRWSPEIEACRELSVLVAVALDVGVEQEQPVSPDVNLPHLREQRLVRERAPG